MNLKKRYKVVKPFLLCEEGDVLVNREENATGQWYVEDDLHKHHYGVQEIASLVADGHIVAEKAPKCQCKA